MPALYQPYCEAHSQCTGPKGQQPCPFYFSGASSTAFEAQGDSAQWGFTYFNSSGDNHSPTEQKLEDSNMTSHVCGLCSLKIKDSPDLEGQMVKG